MPVVVPRGPGVGEDEGIRAVVGVLSEFLSDHPGATAEVYRHGRYVIRIRIVADEFKGRTRTDRHRQVWQYLERLPEDVLSDVNTVVILAPDEKGRSFASFEFDDPVPARL